MYDRPSENSEEMGLPNEFHDVQHPNWYKCSDWFLVIGVPASTTQADAHLSYVMWQEQIAPFMVELLSPGTEAEDLGQTLQVVSKLGSRESS
jgi:Uma2 family endonuclease